MSQFTNLPGIDVNIADGGLILPEDALTQSMLIIAPSIDANAPEEPVLVREDADLVTYSFGKMVDKDGKVNPIAGAWKAAHDGGARQVYLMALKGDTDKARFAHLQDALFGILADFQVDHIVAVGVYADGDVEDILASDLKQEEDQINFPNVPGIIRFGGQVKGTATLSAPIEISTALTNDTLGITVSGGTEIVVTLTAKTYSGTAGLTVNDLAADLTAEFLATEGLAKFQAVIEEGKLVITGDNAFTISTGNATLGFSAGAASVKVRHNEGQITHASFAQVLSDFAEVQTENHSAVVAYIGVKAPSQNSLSAVKTWADALVARQNEYSGYVSVVSGPILGVNIPGLNGVFYTDGALSFAPVTYAALVAQLRAESATTNKTVFGVAGMWFNLSLRQLNALTGKKYVSFRLKNGRVVVTDGCTTAKDLIVGGQKRPSDFARLSTLRITQAAVQLVRDTAEPFIGEPNRMPQYNALNAAIKGALEAMKSQGAINDYRFTIVARGATLNEAAITLEIIPAFELKKISVNVSLRPSF